MTQMITTISETWDFQVGEDVKLKQQATHIPEAAAEAEHMAVVPPGPESWTRWCSMSSVPGFSTDTLDKAKIIFFFFSWASNSAW